MALFHFKKKDQPANCNCGGKCEQPGAAQAQVETNDDASILILGGGCDKCRQLEAATKTAMEQLGWDDTIGHITDFAQIAAYGVMTTPALVVDGKVVSYGKVLKPEEIAGLLHKVR